MEREDLEQLLKASRKRKERGADGLAPLLVCRTAVLCRGSDGLSQHLSYRARAMPW
jgi:hypothetical protein